MNTTVAIPSVITHANIEPLLKALRHEPEFKIGSKLPAPPDPWYRQEAILEVPTGELCADGLKTMALKGRHEYETAALDGSEGFDAQGLEGKVRIRKDLFSALMNLRDLITPGRGRILTQW